MSNVAFLKKTLSLFVSLALICAFVPAVAYADESEESGRSTEADVPQEQALGEISGESAEDSALEGNASSGGDVEGGSDEAEQNEADGIGVSEATIDGAEEVGDVKASDEEGDRANSWRYTDGELTVVEPQALTRSVTPAWEWNGSGYVSSNGEIIEGALFKGIDVSEHQGKINWAKVKADGIDFAIIRCGYGQDQANQDDDCWEYNVSECERLGIPYGVYLYSYADSVQKASGEADHALRLLKGHSPQLPVYYDLEESSLESASNRALLADMATTFCNKIKSAGYVPGVYANLNWWNNYLTDPVFDQWDRWVAQYNYECRYKGEYSFWQCTSSGSVDGISGNVDINFAFNNKYLTGQSAASGFRHQKADGTYAKNEWVTISGKKYYFGSDTYAVKWEQIIGGKLYYFDEDYAMHTGWLTWWKDGTRSYFGSDGAALSGVQKIDGSTYGFSDSGLHQTLKWEQTIGGKVYYFDPDDGYRAHVGWLTWWRDSTRTYFGPDGAALSGWQTISGKRYYFDPGNWCHGLRWEHAVGGKLYYFNEDCSMHTGWLTWWRDQSKSYFNADGAAQSGWMTLSGKRYYLDPETYKSVKWEKQIDGKLYYFDEDYTMHTGWLTWWRTGAKSYFDSDGSAISGLKTIGNKLYLFSSSGLHETQKWEHVINGKLYYFNPDNGYSAHTGWLTWWRDRSKSYFGSDGVAQSGWKTLSGKRYYIDPITFKTVRWEQTIGGKQYYFNDDYSMHTGLVTWWKDGTKSFYGNDGVIASGWQSWSGSRYYFDPKTYKAVQWSQTIEGKEYYFDEHYRMHTGWLRWNATGKYSFYDSNGVIVKGKRTIHGVTYDFGTTGRIDLDWIQLDIVNKAQSYSSSTGYLILVNTLENKVAIFTGRSGNWNLSKYWKCSDGAAATPTVKGTFTVQNRGRSFGSGYTCWYWTQFYGNYLFHSVLYNPGSMSSVQDGRIGYSISHGCVRLELSNAKWIYDNIPRGTKVVIY